MARVGVGVRIWLIRWAVRVLAGFVLLVGIVLVLLVVFEQRWGRLVVEQSLEALNAQLAVPVSTSDISFTFFRNFPHASLHLRNVFIPSTLPRGDGRSDTLLLAESVYLVLAPFELLRSEYRIARCLIENGYIYLREDGQGRTNYSIFRATPSDTLEPAAHLAVNRLVLRQIALEYRAERSQMHASALLGELEASGAFGGERARLRVSGEGLVEVLQQGAFVYAKRQHFSLESQLQRVGGLVITSGTQLVLDRNRFYLKGQVDTDTGELALTATGQELDLRSVLGFASQFQWQPPASVDVTGQLYASLTLSGSVRRNGLLKVDMALRGTNMSLRIRDATYDIPRLQARFSNGDKASPASTTLELTDCLITHRESSISLIFSMSNLVKPIFYTKFAANLQSQDIIPSSMQEYIRGYETLNVSGELLSQLKGLDTLSLSSLVNPRLNMQCAFTGLSVVPHDSVLLEDLDGSITVIENDLAKSAISGRWGDIPFSCGASIRNALALLTGRGESSWTVSTSLADADLARLRLLFASGSGSRAAGQDEDGFWSRTSSIMGNLSLRGCRYGRLPLERLDTRFTLSPHDMQMHISDAALLGGQVSGRLAHRSDVLTASLSLSHLNLKALLQGTDNFGQDVITSGNIDGLLSGAVSVHAPLDSGRLRWPDLEVEADVRVEGGALSDIRGLEQLSRFISLDELRHIRFSTLSNRISLRQQRVVIPRMQVNSSALGLALSGEHHFNSSYQYRIALRLSDLLFHRMKGDRRALSENSLADTAQSGGHSLFLILEGDSVRSSVRFDHAAFRERMQERIARERNTLETMLQEEFGGASPVADPNREPAYTIEWEEMGDSATAKRPATPKAPQKPKAPVRITWDED